MSSKSPASQILKAAAAGNHEAVKQLLASGAPLEATDVNNKTPIMLAAEGGHLETFRLLIDSGANLHALALCSIDLLECAAGGGNIEIVRECLRRGLPVDGHWQPRSSVARRMGHLTPLLMATLYGRVDVVRLLLDHGANRDATHDGMTASRIAQDNINHPLGEEEAARKDQYQEIVRLLAGNGGPAEAETTVADLVKQFADNAEQPTLAEFQEVLLAKGASRYDWRPDPDHALPSQGVVAYRWAGCRTLKAMRGLQDAARSSGFHLVLTEPWQPGEAAFLALFPTDSKFAVIAATGTNGANHGLDTPAIIDWLTTLEEHNPFDLTGCGCDFILGEFPRAVSKARALAEQIIEFCPGCFGDEPPSIAQLAASLKQDKSFALRWD